MSGASFYYDFERSFRGDRDEIRGRLKRGYTAFLAALAGHVSAPKALDLGCGRGEWLEVATELGFSAHGVDLDEDMLADCLARGLSVTRGDAIDYLAHQPDHSLAVVSGFHIAEHLPFDALLRLIAEACRALCDGGLLILETPNAENIGVGTLSFHMDPTHNKPLPPGLLSFLARRSGFVRAEIIRLQERDELRDSNRAGLLDVLQGVSPDYALVAQKAGPAELASEIDHAFRQAGGLTLNMLAERFETSVVAPVQTQVDDLRLDIVELHGLVDDLRLDVVELHGLVEQQDRRLDEQWQHLSAVYASTSWRITGPMRSMSTLLQREKRQVLGASRRVLRAVARFPLVRRLALRLERRLPERMAALRRLVSGGADAGVAEASGYRQHLDVPLLSPRATHILARLTAGAEGEQ